MQALNTAPIDIGTGPLFLSWQCTDYGPHSCSLRYAGINSVFFMSNHPFVLLFL